MEVLGMNGLVYLIWLIPLIFRVKNSV